MHLVAQLNVAPDVNILLRDGNEGFCQTLELMSLFKSLQRSAHVEVDRVSHQYRFRSTRTKKIRCCESAIIQSMQTAWTKPSHGLQQSWQTRLAAMIGKFRWQRQGCHGVAKIASTSKIHAGTPATLRIFVFVAMAGAMSTLLGAGTVKCILPMVAPSSKSAVAPATP